MSRQFDDILLGSIELFCSTAEIMPYILVQVADEGVTREQKAKIIAGASGRRRRGRNREHGTADWT